VAIERDSARAERIARNALRLGVPSLEVVTAAAPAALDGLAAPDAIFVGGGLTADGLLERCRAELARGGRLVANAVTVEGEGVLARAHAQWGGRLVRLAVAQAQPLGGYTAWRPAMAITQWELR
jgi:precorrin-6Y C5,15-methyltransferase (decarboxylating)